MKALVLPLILALIGVTSGVGAGLMFKSKSEDEIPSPPCGESASPQVAHDAKASEEHGGQETGRHGVDGAGDEAEYVKLNNQFVVPVVNDDLVEALVVMSLSLEVEPGQQERIYAQEPKLRDAFLQVLFDHSNMGGFRGNFTRGKNLDMLRASLTEVAQNILGPSVKSVLIFDIARQDV